MTQYTCPMHPEVMEDAPGSCPDCGMGLEAIALPAATQYTCPMHPEVIEDAPGDCPDCGMALEPMTVALAATETRYTCPMQGTWCGTSPATARNAAWRWSR